MAEVLVSGGRKNDRAWSRSGLCPLSISITEMFELLQKPNVNVLNDNSGAAVKTLYRASVDLFRYSLFQSVVCNVIDIA